MVFQNLAKIGVKDLRFGLSFCTDYDYVTTLQTLIVYMCLRFKKTTKQNQILIFPLISPAIGRGKGKCSSLPLSSKVEEKRKRKKE